MPTPNTFSDYTSTSAGVGSSEVGDRNEGYWSLSKLKRSYMDYLNSKTQEVEEQKEARRYRHASQYTAEQIKVLNRRKQPVVTFNRIGRKIDAIVGLIEKLKQAPKAYPRTPKEEEGAELATAVVRYVLDNGEWKAKAPQCAEDGAIDGIGGLELVIEPGDEGDPDIGFEIVEPDSFFYDPRSYRLDFSDARYMGMGKWVDLEQAQEMFPDKADDMEEGWESTELSTNSDREQKWFSSGADGQLKRVRIVEEWYQSKGNWYYCVYTGSMKLAEGRSYLKDENGKDFCKFIMFAANVDQDGDRYGFVRNLKSAQDEINQRRSKALHTLNTRRIIAEQGAFDDIEVARREAVRPDGVVIRNKGFEAEFDDAARSAELEGQVRFLEDAKQEIENFGPNPALVGDMSHSDQSGRAIALLQQAGVAELGPFILAYRGWKVRVYRAIWNSVREHWTQERWVRVTDDDQSVQFVGLNQVSIDPQTGRPAMVNQVSSLDVDIVMDEGPDTVTLMQDTNQALMALVQAGQVVPPQLLIETSPLDPAIKKKYIEMMNAPDPVAQQKQQLELQNAQAVIADKAAAAKLKQAQTISVIHEVQNPDQGGSTEHPAVTQANVENTQADTMYKKAQTIATLGQAQLAPREQAHQEQMDHVQARQADQQNKIKAHDSAVKAQQGAEQNQIKAFDSQAKAAQGAEQNQIAREGHEVTREANQQKTDVAREGNQIKAQSDGTKPKKKKKSGGVNISLDGTMASQLNEHAKANTESISQVANVLGEATKVLAQASKSMADSSNSIAHSMDAMSKAISAPKRSRIVRDAKGRASHVESV